MTPPTIAPVLLTEELEAPAIVRFPVESADAEGPEEPTSDVTDAEEINEDVDDGEVADGEVADGEVADGEVADGEVVDGVALVEIEELNVLGVPEAVVNAAKRWSVRAAEAQAM